MKVIFLDFDGVLNSALYRDSVDNYHNNFIDETRMPYLKRIVDETGAVIVLSTTWKTHWDEKDKSVFDDTKRINDIFAKFGLKIHSKTENCNDNRNLEISLWLCSNVVENYVILDDLDFHWSEENRKHFVKTDDARYGLDEQTTNLAVKILE